MKKEIILLFLFVFIQTFLGAQDIRHSKKDTLVWNAKNAIFFELFGAGGMPLGYTLNYDRLLHSNGIFRTSVRVGANPYPLAGFFTFPIMVNLLIGKKACFELGVGGDLVVDNSNDQKYTGGAFTSVIGFRYQDFNRGLFFRAGLTPTVGGTNGGFFVSLVGVSLGYSF